MASIRVKGEIIITHDDNQDAPIPFDFTQTFTSIENKVYSLSPNATKIVWDPAVDNSEATADFDTAIFLSDGVLDLGTTNTSDSDIQTLRLANGLPFMLGADDSSGAAGPGAAATDINLIGKFTLDEPNSATVSVRVILAT